MISAFTDSPDQNDSEERYVYTVTELTREIKVLLETTIPLIWVEGEISNFKLHSSGHMYFSLKDESAQISAVMWRGRNQGLRFTPEDGMKVLAQGRVTVYEKRGNYQLDVQQLQPAGVGELQLAFEQLKSRLFEEGLFDEEHKKPIPTFPERIGIITSPTGAAIRDLVSVSTRRLPSIELILRPVRVQGEGAAEEIAQAIREFNEYGEVNLLIVGRGGGSLEDLWAFNEEVVARAIFASQIPVVSAVGHEVDFTISDFVADLRAPTPSAAAEIVVPDSDQLSEAVRGLAARSHQSVSKLVERYRDKLQAVRSSYGFRRPKDIVHQHQQRLDDLTRSIATAMFHLVALAGQKQQALAKRLVSLGPESVLARGYSVCYRLNDGSIVKETTALRTGEDIGVQFHRGRAEATINEIDVNDNIDSFSKRVSTEKTKS